MNFPRRVGLYAEYRLTGGWRHAETDLWHEPEPGRLHRRARRRPRLERAERRAVPVVVRPGGGDGPGAVRAQTVADDERPLADRRPAAWRHTGAGVTLTTVQGNLFFEDLDIFAGSSGLAATGTATGLTLAVAPTVSTISSVGGPAVNINTAAITLQLASQSSTNTTKLSGKEP